MNYQTFKDVKNFMLSDIKREIEISKEDDAGNLLCALGLLCYTESMGKLLVRDSSCTEAFNSFFSKMGGEYKSLIEDRDVDVYGDLRCDLVHEFAIDNCKVFMPGLEKEIGVTLKDNIYHFYVGKYYLDFKKAVEKIEEEKYK